MGDLAGLMSMAATVLGGTALLWAFVPETKPTHYVD
jgi:hypothetical protein